MKKTTNVKPSSSFTIVELNPDHSFNIDQPTLTDIVKEKNLEARTKHDCVDGIASAPQAKVNMAF